MRHRMMISFLCIILFSTFTHAGVTPGGLRGLIENLDASNDGIGTLTLGLHGLYRSQDWFDGSDQTNHIGQTRLSISYALANFLEFGAYVPYHLDYLTDNDEDISQRKDLETGIGDMETRAKISIPMGEFQAIKLGLFGFYRFDSGDEDKGFSSGAKWYGGSGLLTVDLAQAVRSAPFKIHLNAGIQTNDDENATEIMRLSGGVEFPTPSMSFFVELTTDQLNKIAGQDTDIDFSDSPVWLTPGVRFGGKDDSYMDIGVRVGLNGDDAVYAAPDWEIVLTLGMPSMMARRDRDDDGVSDDDDLCPDTPVGAVVDIRGCPLDTDLDGIYDGLDRCPETPRGALVDPSGCPLDGDEDGVPDGIDRCPNSPAGATVNKWGCTEDSDGDGVPDGMDKCAGTPAGATVDERGCPKDADGDGVPDGIDQCADTPPNVPVDRVGCPTDSDGDGVPDGKDKCADTRPGTAVDEQGCPVDADSDGIPDGLDRCPDTPYGAQVDRNGCPLDSDGDGVYDGLDKCPDTPIKAKVDSLGCPEDADLDGVPDGVDICPDTPYGATVDRNGCPLDSDGDGVYDGLDKCPDTRPGSKVNSYGCPERIRLEGVNFAYDSAELLPESLPVLDKSGQLLDDVPEMRVRIEGHTDSDGSDSYNLRLSQRRAESVRAYLIKRFNVDPNRIEARGFGETMPIASNDTSEGKALNRRVEFVILEQ